MPQDSLVIRDARQLAQIIRLGCILRLPQQKLLLQAKALYQADELETLISLEKRRSMDHLQAFSWNISLQRSLSGLLCQIHNRFFDSRSDRHFVRLQVYRRAAALCRCGTPMLEDICHAAALDIPYSNSGTNPHCVSSALREGGGVCQAIAHYLCQLLLRCGYPCVVRTGTLNGVSHAWNQVLVNGQWRRLDLCVNGPAVYEDKICLPPSEQYDDMCGNLNREVVLLDHESSINGVKAPFFIANRRWVCPTRFVQCFNGAYSLEDGHLLLCLGPVVRRLPLTCLHENSKHLPYMEAQQFARLLQLQYADDRLLFTEGL